MTLPLYQKFNNSRRLVTSNHKLAVLSYRQVETRRDLSLRLTRNNETQYFLLYKSFSNFKAFDITLSNSILSSTILNFKYMLGLASAATILNFKYMLGLAVRTHTFLF